jgi:hypothetical protein
VHRCDILPEFNTISKCCKKKKSRRHSGGIIVYYKKTISRGVTYLNYGSKSENRLWLKLDKSFFDFEHDLYVCRYGDLTQIGICTIFQHNFN